MNENKRHKLELKKMKADIESTKAKTAELLIQNERERFKNKIEQATIKASTLRPVAPDNDAHPGIPFYCLNGPLEGEVIFGDFRKSSYTGSVGMTVEYRKTRFGMEGNFEGLKFYIKVDVAHVGECPALPGEAIKHASLRFIPSPPKESNDG